MFVSSYDVDFSEVCGSYMKGMRTHDDLTLLENKPSSVRVTLKMSLTLKQWLR